MKDSEAKDSQNFYCVISLAGLGLGNATRCHAVIMRLKSMLPGLMVTVFAWGKALAYFKQQNLPKGVRVVALFPYVTEQASLVAGLFWPFLYFVNCFIIMSHLFRNPRPRFILSDSDYHLLAFMCSGAPRLALNQSPAVRYVWENLKVTPSWRHTLNYLLREMSDYLLSTLFFDKVFCPAFSPFTTKNRNIQLVRPPIRDQFCRAEHNQTSSEIWSWAGGSKLGLKEFAKLEAIVSAVRQEPNWIARQNLRPKGLLIQGGFSSITEALALGVSPIILPLRHHSEQLANATWIESLGLGIHVRDSDANHLPHPSGQSLNRSPWSELPDLSRLLVENYLSNSGVDSKSERL